MPQTIPKLPVDERPDLGTRAAIKLRRSGRLPLVIYGHKQDAIHVSADRKVLTDLLHQHTRLVEVSVGVGPQVEPCLVKEVQWDHLGSTILHVDLTRVDLNEKVSVEIELVLVGEPKGTKQAGAYLEHPVTRVEVECLATQIPENIRVDVSELDVGDSLAAGAISLPEGVDLVSDAGHA